MPPYDARSITVLRGLEAVRRRPSMYVGSTGPQGLLNLAMEVVQNAVDEALAGHCRRIVVALGADGSVAVEDDGRGIPVDIHPAVGRPACEVVLTTLHAGGKFEDGHYRAPGGLHGVGVSCVNALSSWLTLDIWRDGGHWRQRFARGEVAAPLERIADSAAHGTRVAWLPDPEIFGDERLPIDALIEHLQAQAFLGAGLEIQVEAPGRTERFACETGLAGYVAWLNRARVAVHAEPIVVSGSVDGIEIAAAMQWTFAWAEEIRTYANSIATPQGGTHAEGLKAALTAQVNRCAAALGLAEGESVAGYDVREGLACVLSVRMREPEFEGQTKSALTSGAATDAVARVVGEGLAAWLSHHPTEAAAIVGRALEAGRARAAARRASERARYKKVDLGADREVYRQQFGIRSKNWHDSARWLTDAALLGAHGASCRMGPDAEVLDTCCGSGVVGASFRGRVGRITGLDLTPQMAELARTRLDEVVLGDVYDIPFPEGRFDLVCNREVLHLLPQPERPVAEMFRVLKPGGQIVVGQMVPFGDADAPWLFRVLKKKQPLFFNHLTEADMRALLLGAGFTNLTMTEVLQWEDIDLWIDTWETPNLNRHEIRDLYHHAPAEVRAVHPFEITPRGAIRDCWRWCVFSGFK